MNFYNEIDPKAAAWLRALIADGHIADGIVDERSIADINPHELHDFKQCHWFAGIAGWSLALRLAGVPDDFPVWTGSCPCQPFSVGNVAHGGAKGTKDVRHLWPEFYRLIRKCQPPIVIGEQVANAIGKGWLDEVFGDLEGSNYACGAAVLPACAFNADHERKRLYWIANAGSKGRKRHQPFQCVPVSNAETFPIAGDYFTDARRALDGDFSHLRGSNGVSLQLERDALKGFGNAIVPQVAAEFIKAGFEAINEQ